MTILTERLRLVPDTLERQAALIEGALPFLEKFGVRVAEGMQDFVRSVQHERVAAIYSACAAADWTAAYGIEHVADNTLVGSFGYYGPPDANRTVEIAYGFVPAYQGRGFATETVRALVEHISRTGRVAVIRAHTLPLPNASTRVLLKCGFTKVAEMIDPEDGPVWRWERAAVTG